MTLLGRSTLSVEFKRKVKKVWFEKFANVLAHVWGKWNKEMIMELNRMELSNGDIELKADATELTRTWKLTQECTIRSTWLIGNK